MRIGASSVANLARSRLLKVSFQILKLLIKVQELYVRGCSQCWRHFTWKYQDYRPCRQIDANEHPRTQWARAQRPSENKYYVFKTLMTTQSQLGQHTQAFVLPSPHPQKTVDWSLHQPTKTFMVIILKRPVSVIVCPHWWARPPTPTKHCTPDKWVLLTQSDLLTVLP